MPGPGGGSRGGGGFRGGGFGGGFGGGHGGGFGGGFHGGHRGGYHGGWHHRPYGGWFHRPMFYGRGGCFGGLLSIIMLPVIVILVLVVGFGSFIGNGVSELSRGGTSTYNENKFQDYADSQYAAEFGSSTAYEDNILLVFLAEDEEYYDYAYIAWVGDHITTNINTMFGNNYTQLGRAIEASVNASSYKYSLDSNLAQVVTIMQNHIKAVGADSSFSCSEQHEQVKSHLTNKTNINMTEETVNAALTEFTNATGIPIVIVVEDIEDVFPKKLSALTIVALIMAVLLVVLVVWLIVRAVRNKKGGSKGDEPKRKYDSRGNRI